MNDRKLFVLSVLVAAGITLAVGFLNATLPLAGERPLSPEGAVALVDDACRLTGAIALAADGVVAEFAVTNAGTAATTVEFHYAVEKTPKMSPFSRMIPRPEQVKRGRCALTVAAGGEQIERIVVAPTNGAPDDLWTLKVSRSEITNTAGWGGVPPGILSTTGQLTDAVLILAAPKPADPTPGFSLNGESWTPGLVTTGAMMVIPAAAGAAK